MTKEKKPPSRRTNAKEEVDRIATLFAPLINKEIQFSFGKFSFPIIIQTIQLAKITDMKNAPEKRKDENNKMYTPNVMQMNTNAGLLYFVLEDVRVVAIANGIQIITAANKINFREE